MSPTTGMAPSTRRSVFRQDILNVTPGANETFIQVMEKKIRPEALQKMKAEGSGDAAMLM